MIVNNTPPILIGPMGGGSSENSSVSGEVAGLGFTKILAGQLSVEPKIDLETLGSLSQKSVEESRPKEDADTKDAAVSDQSVEMVMAFVMPSQPMEAKPVVASEASPESSTSSIDTIETGGSGQELFTHTDSAAPAAASSAYMGSQANVSSDSGVALTGTGWVLEQQTTTVDPNIVSSEQAASAVSTPEPVSTPQTSTTAAAFENAAGNSVPSTARMQASSEKSSPSTDGMRTSSFGSANSSEVSYKAQVIRDALSRVIQRLMERTDAHWTPRFRPSYQGTPVSTPIDSSLLQQAQKAANSTPRTIRPSTSWSWTAPIMANT
jgi:hypothetical protein